MFEDVGDIRQKVMQAAPEQSTINLMGKAYQNNEDDLPRHSTLSELRPVNVQLKPLEANHLKTLNLQIELVAGSSMTKLDKHVDRAIVECEELTKRLEGYATVEGVLTTDSGAEFYDVTIDLKGDAFGLVMRNIEEVGASVYAIDQIDAGGRKSVESRFHDKLIKQAADNGVTPGTFTLP